MRTEENPVIISTLPLPRADDYIERKGRFGSHNLHENLPLSTSFFSDTLIFGTYFNAGVRVHDIADPFKPKEVAYFVPPETDGQRGININDVYVDENGLVYAIDRFKGGLYILELNI